MQWVKETAVIRRVDPARTVPFAADLCGALTLVSFSLDSNAPLGFIKGKAFLE
jgi:hypothetical protein